ncbi:MAG TPA: efflux RND transporter periplasmic adaptor subunit [Clostridia bacterium]|jgi:HlyD family secretion protein|nr:efflux RND transporter periplasmic adaptor subunit [Clostridia bacterium]
MKKKAKIILGSLCLVALVLFLVFNKSNDLDAKLLKVQPRTIAKTFTEEGLVKAAKEDPLYTTSGGKIIDLHIQEGQQVQKGQLLLTFDPTELHFELQQLQGQLKSLQAQQELELSKLGLDKLKELYAIGAISQKEYEDALHTANSDYYPGQIETLRAQIESLRYKLTQSSVYAPVSGIISQLDLREGMVLAPGTPLCTIYQEGTYLVEGYVLTEDAAHIHPNMEVKLIQDNKEQEIGFKGWVQKIAPAAEEKMSALGLLEQRLKVTIEPELPENLILKPGYALDIEFTINKQEDKLVVPKTVLFPYQDGEALWVVRQNTAQIQPVETGFENERDIVIEKGLKAGDLVLLDPQLEGLKEGIRIKPIF